MFATNNALTEEENTSHHIIYKNIDVINHADLLLKNLNFTKKQQFSLLLISIQHGYLSIFSSLIQKYPSCINKTWLDQTTLLHMAVESKAQNNLALVTCLLEQGAIQIRDDKQIYPIQLAWQHAKKELFDAMLASMLKDIKQTIRLLTSVIQLPGFDLWNYRDDNGHLFILNNCNQATTVLAVSAAGQLEKLKWLIDIKGYSLEVTKDYGKNPVLFAAYYGRLETLKWLVEVKGCSLRVKQDDGSDSVLLASYGGQLETLKWLIDVKKCSLQVKGDQGYDSVLHAACKGQLETLKWLVQEKGCSLHVKTNLGDTPVLCAAYHGHLKTLKWLVEVKGCSLQDKDCDDDDAVLSAALEGRLEVLQWLVEEKNCSLEVKDIDGFDPVLCAAYGGQLKILEWLIDVKNCSLEICDHDGDNPVLLASQQGNLTVLKWLIKTKDCFMHPKNDLGMGPVLAAVKGGQFETLEWLVDAAHDSLGEIDKDGKEAVLCAVHEGKFEILKWLVDVKKCSLRVRDFDGNNASLLAAYQGELEILKWLIEEKNCSLEVGNEDGNDPVLQAALNGKLEILKWLIDVKKCSLNICNDEGEDSVLLALSRHHEEVLEWLFFEKSRSFILARFQSKNSIVESIKELSGNAFVKFFSYFFGGFAEIDETSLMLDIIKEQYHKNSQDIKNKILQCYETIISDWCASSKEIGIMMESYSALNPISAFQFEINLLCQLDNNENQYQIKAVKRCLKVIESTDTELKKWGKILLAEMLLLGLEMEEEGSPLNHSNIKLLGAKQNSASPSIMGRAIQAFYLLHDIDDNDYASKLKNQLHSILSFNLIQDYSKKIYSEETWDQSIKDYYYVYYIYKSCPGSQHGLVLANETHKKVEKELKELFRIENQSSSVSTQGFFTQTTLPQNNLQVNNQDQDEDELKKDVEYV